MTNGNMFANENLLVSRHNLEPTNSNTTGRGIAGARRLVHWRTERMLSSSSSYLSLSLAAMQLLMQNNVEKYEPFDHRARPEDVLRDDVFTGWDMARISCKMPTWVEGVNNPNNFSDFL